MAIDWASSSEDEFPDLDVVLARAKAAKPKVIGAATTSIRKLPNRSRSSQLPKEDSVSDPDKEPHESRFRAQGISAPTLVRRRKLGPRTDSSILKPLVSERTGSNEADGDIGERKFRTKPKIQVRALRANKSRSTTTTEDERAAISSRDSSGSDGSMSDFIVYTDDDSDAYSERSVRLKPTDARQKTRPARGSQEVKESAAHTSPKGAPEREGKKATATKTKPSKKLEAPQKLSAPTTDSITDALGRLDLTQGSSSAVERHQTPPTTPPKAINNKKTLISPQKLAAVPKTPHRPSMELFWDQEFFNEWNEEHSPRKLFLPKVSKTPAKSPVKEEKLKAVSDKAAKKLFESRKHQLAESFLRELDDSITDGQIFTLAASTGGVKIQWSKTLNTTAGRANWKRETIRSKGDAKSGGKETLRYNHHASIELAEKVISDEHRLLNVLAHEFCHLANFMITGITTNPHGKEFKAWAAKVSRAFADRDIEVTTKHSYEIDFKYVWECGECAIEYKRHSKSINPERHRCGACKGKLLQTRPAPRGASRAAAGVAGAATGSAQGAGAKKEPSEYQRFVKEQMRVVREENPGSPQKDMMRLVAEKWARTRGEKSSRTQSREASIESVAIQLKDLAL